MPCKSDLNNLANQPVLGQGFMGLIHRLSELFNEESTVADENSIYYYVKNLVVRGQLEYEVPIVSLVYLVLFFFPFGKSL